MSNLKSAFALGAAIVTLSIGGAFAAGVQTEGQVNVMSGPGDNYKLIGRLEANADVSIIRQSGDWCRIDSTALKGWVGCGDLTTATPRTDAAPAPASDTGYNWGTDPMLGPAGELPFHTNHNGTFN